MISGLSATEPTQQRAMTLLPCIDPEEVCRQLERALDGAEQPSRRAD